MFLIVRSESTFGMMSYGESNVFLLQWIASSSTFCFLFSMKLIAVLNKQSRETFYTRILTSFTNLNQLKWKVSVICTYPFFITSGIEKELVTKIVISLWIQVSCTLFLLDVFLAFQNDSGTVLICLYDLGRAFSF